MKYKKYKLKVRTKDGQQVERWYARTTPDKVVDFNALVEHMGEHNIAYSRGVISGVLTDMLDCVKELVLDGKSVRLGDLGLFSVGLTTDGAATAAEWKTSMVKGVRLLVRNTKTWSNAELRKLCSLSEQGEYVRPDAPATGGGDNGEEV